MRLFEAAGERGGGPSVAAFAAGALAAAEAWLLRPADTPLPERDQNLRGLTAPVVAVFGLAPACGTSTVARALALELARRAGSGPAIVASAEPLAPGAVGLGTRAASRLAREVAADTALGAKATGHLCVAGGADYMEIATAARSLAPLVLDTAAGDPAPAAAAVADAAVLVARPEQEPALAEVVRDSLTRVGPEPLVVLNRAFEAGDWEGLAVAVLPEARALARLALAGRDPGRALGAGVGAVLDRIES